MSDLTLDLGQILTQARIKHGPTSGEHAQRTNTVTLLYFFYSGRVFKVTNTLLNYSLWLSGVTTRSSLRKCVCVGGRGGVCAGVVCRCTVSNSKIYPALSLTF